MRRLSSAPAEAALVALVTVVVAAAAPARAEVEPRPTAMLPLSIGGGAVTLDEGARLEADLRAGLQSARGVALQPAEATRLALESADSMGLTCDRTEVACAVETGKLLGVSQIVLGRATKDAEAWGISLSVLDVGVGRVVRRAEGRAPFEAHARAERMGELARELFSPSSLLAELTLDVAPAGAEVLVDGASVGRAPLPGSIPVRPGKHVVAARAPGHEPTEMTIDVQPGARMAASMRLGPQAAAAPSPVAAPPSSGGALQAGLLWGGVGLAGVGAGLLVAAGGSEIAATGAVDALVRLEQGFTLEQAAEARRLHADAELYRGLAIGLSAAGAAALVVGGAAASAGLLLMPDEGAGETAAR